MAVSSNPLIDRLCRLADWLENGRFSSAAVRQAVVEIDRLRRDCADADNDLSALQAASIEETDPLREMAAAYSRECAQLGAANVALTAENRRLRAALHEIERRCDDDAGIADRGTRWAVGIAREALNE